MSEALGLTKVLQDAIAEANAALPVATEITAQDAESYCDDDVLMGYWTLQQATRSPGDTWFDLYEKLTDNERTQVVAAIVNQHPAGLRVLRDALVAHVSEWLATQAQQVRDEMPSDEPAERPFDPYLAERRAFTRRHNATLSARRVSHA